VQAVFDPRPAVPRGGVLDCHIGGSAGGPSVPSVACVVLVVDWFHGDRSSCVDQARTPSRLGGQPSLTGFVSR
jgi:hypothetical protein